MITQKEWKKLENLLDKRLDHKLFIFSKDIKDYIQTQLIPIKERLDKIEYKLNQFFKMESEDIEPTYKDIEIVKKQVKEITKKIQILELKTKN